MDRPADASNRAWPRGNDEDSVRLWLHQAIGVNREEREATAMVRWLLDEASGLSRGQRMMHSPYRFPESQLNRLGMWARELSHGRPIQHVLGHVHFAGLTLHVGPQALVPRPETEELVALALQALLGMTSPGLLEVLDIGTGSGCIALALKHGLNQAGKTSRVVGEDVSLDALLLARRNAATLDLDVDLIEADALGFSPRESSFDAILSNPPYIPTSERATMDDVVTRHDPALALFVPDDRPLLFYEAILRRCESAVLRPGGVCILECHTAFAHEVCSLFQQSKAIASAETLPDLQGLPRFVQAWKVS